MWQESLIAQSPAGMDKVLAEFTGGTLLCDVVAAVLGRPVAGLLRKPRNAKTSEANILKALDILWEQRTMSRRSAGSLRSL